MIEPYGGPEPTVLEMAGMIAEAEALFLRQFGETEKVRTRYFLYRAAQLLRQLHEESPDCPKCHGTKRVIDYRATAVRDVDAVVGYSIEFSPDPGVTAQNYDILEERLISSESTPRVYDWTTANREPNWETMPCICRTGKLPLVRGMQIASRVLDAEPMAMNFATFLQWLEEIRS